jgi:hypothetical protein
MKRAHRKHTCEALVMAQLGRERMAMLAEALWEAGTAADVAVEQLLCLLRSRRPPRLDRLASDADATTTAANSLRGPACLLGWDRETTP